MTFFILDDLQTFLEFPVIGCYFQSLLKNFFCFELLSEPGLKD
jgi:hypothetical protein